MRAYNCTLLSRQENHNPTPIVIEECAEMSGYRLTAENHIIFSIYGDHLYRNYGTHLDGGVTYDAVCQCRLWHIRNLIMRWYYLLQGRTGCRFVNHLMAEREDKRLEL